jgi:hypothetical protein
VANDLFGNFLVQTGNACFIERIKATAQCIIVDMKCFNAFANQPGNQFVIKKLAIHCQCSPGKPQTIQ